MFKTIMILPTLIVCFGISVLVADLILPAPVGSMQHEQVNRDTVNGALLDQMFGEEQVTEVVFLFNDN